MLFLIIYLALIFVVLGVGAVAAHSDIKGMTIPNVHSVIILAAFVPCYGLLWLGGYEAAFFPLMSHVLSFVLVFVLTAGLFALKLIGAGDSKLASAYAIWMGVPGLVPFLFYMALAGGVLGLCALILKKYTPVKDPKPDSWVAQVQGGANKVPYGVAIVIGALASFVKIGYFNVDNFSLFIAS